MTEITMATNNAAITTEKSILKLQTTVRKWGNSQGIRLSKEILAYMNLKENDTIGINVYDDIMTIQKIKSAKPLNLQERLEAFYQKNIDEIFVESTEEVSVGEPAGDELW